MEKDPATTMLSFRIRLDLLKRIDRWLKKSRYRNRTEAIHALLSDGIGKDLRDTQSSPRN